MKRFSNKQAGVLSHSDLKTTYGKILYWIFFAVLLIAALCSMLPALWTVLTAFKDTKEIYEGFSFLPHDLTVQKFISRLSESWKILQLEKSFINTIILSIGDLVVSLVVCGFGGYALSKLKPKGSKVIFVLVVWTMMMPAQVRLVPNYISWLHFPFAAENRLGVSLLDTYWPMWLNAGADTFAVLLFKNAFDGLSNSYIEAARLDGCTNYGIFFKIMIPLAAPIFMYQAINVLSSAWSDFFTPLLVLDKNVVVPLKILRLNTDTSVKMNTYFMGLVFSSIPPFAIFIVFQKKILGGVNIGGVKG